MNKEEVLSKAQKEGKGKDFADLESIKTASRIAYIVLSAAMGIVALYFQFRYAIEIVYFWFAAWWLSQSALFITKFVLLRKKHELAITIIYFMFFICFLVLGIIHGQ